VVAGRLAEDDYRLAGSYPALALEWMAANELEPSPMHRVAAPEIVGNLLNLLYADSGVTYYDDRFGHVSGGRVGRVPAPAEREPRLEDVSGG
jgi:hypothetical protein